MSRKVFENYHHTTKNFYNPQSGSENFYTQFLKKFASNMELGFVPQGSVGMTQSYPEGVLEGRSPEAIKSLPNVEEVKDHPNKIEVEREDGIDVYLDKIDNLKDPDMQSLCTVLNKYRLEENNPANIARAVSMVRMFGITSSQIKKYQRKIPILQQKGKDTSNLENAIVELQQDLNNTANSLPSGMAQPKLLN